MGAFLAFEEAYGTLLCSRPHTSLFVPSLTPIFSYAVKTLAAAGIGGFSSILGVVREKAPLRRAIEASEVGDTAAFLLSNAGRGITGEVIMVDAGYHIIGM